MLAVALPGMSVDFLQTLVVGCSENTGIVPRIKE
jgi:hypothetical protein